ncbi:MAG: ParB/RepB/Spo0J family partition protein, partial [Erysipelotrichales bacterium]|nr:ParB/RepB/Spo0J family partition protein [Erysipelotrichales bacterium]
MAEEKKRGLGSGLEAIFGTSFNDFDDLTNRVIEESPNSTEEIDLSRIYPNPYQPRKVFREEELEELADSIREHGVFQPILVKPTDTGYVLLAGERRVRAARIAGLTTIPAIVKDFTDDQLIELSLLENIQREDLSSIEEALSYQQLIEKLGYTQEELAKRVGKSRTHVTNTLR